MTSIRHQRLLNQLLLSPSLKDPVEVVRSLVAVQAQDFHGAKWGLAQRMVSPTDDLIEKAFTAGRILRLHVMRPTWHFVAPDDVRWLLNLTASRLKATHNYYFRKSELDDGIIKQTNKVLTKALRDGKQLTRAELRDVVKRSGIEPGDSVRFGRILFRAELDGVVCSGARKGNQFTYALLADRVPRSRILERDEALTELAQRYFTTRGPATPQDFAWWSGLTLTDVKRAIDICGATLRSEIIEDQSYWGAKNSKGSKSKLPGPAYLLPAYDEYFISYKDRTASIHPEFDQKSIAARLVFDAPMVVDGLCVGGWKRIPSNNEVTIQLRSFTTLKSAERTAVKLAAERYANFLGRNGKIAYKFEKGN